MKTTISVGVPAANGRSLAAAAGDGRRRRAMSGHEGKAAQLPTVSVVIAAFSSERWDLPRDAVESDPHRGGVPNVKGIGAHEHAKYA